VHLKVVIVSEENHEKVRDFDLLTTVTMMMSLFQDVGPFNSVEFIVDRFVSSGNLAEFTVFSYLRPCSLEKFTVFQHMRICTLPEFTAFRYVRSCNLANILCLPIQGGGVL
jgi:hypothetical protein